VCIPGTCAEFPMGNRHCQSTLERKYPICRKTKSLAETHALVNDTAGIKPGRSKSEALIQPTRLELSGKQERNVVMVIVRGDLDTSLLRQ
jgi:hypothetical protein